MTSSIGGGEVPERKQQLKWSCHFHICRQAREVYRLPDSTIAIWWFVFRPQNIRPLATGSCDEWCGSRIKVPCELVNAWWRSSSSDLRYRWLDDVSTMTSGRKFIVTSVLPVLLNEEQIGITFNISFCEKNLKKVEKFLFEKRRSEKR